MHGSRFKGPRYRPLLFRKHGKGQEEKGREDYSLCYTFRRAGLSTTPTPHTRSPPQLVIACSTSTVPAGALNQGSPPIL